MNKAEVKFPLRMPTKIHSDVKAAAQAEHRSVNAQILTLVEEALATRKAREAQQQAENSTTNKKPERNSNQATDTAHQLSIEDIPGSLTEVLLTPKQRELLELLLRENLSYRELSQILNINASSVRDRTSTVLRKLGVESRSELLDKFKQNHKETTIVLNKNLDR